MVRVVILLMLFVGCAHRPKGPHAILRFVDPSAWSEQDRHDVEIGVIAWQSVGFVGGVEVTSSLPPCPNDWYRRTPQLTACVIMIGVRREAGVMTEQLIRGGADRDRDMVYVDASLKGFDLMHVIAHEVGHILLNTAKHSAGGVMMSGGYEWVLHAEDRALACETIRRGCP